MVHRSSVVRLGLVVLVGACTPAGREPAPRPPAGPPEPSAVASVAPAIPTSAPSPASSPAALSTATPAPPLPASPAATALVRSAVALEPAARVTLTPGAEVVVHPAATFEVVLSARAADARLVLVDARDDLVPASAAREVGAGTRLTLAPAAPLVPGSRYALRLDGASDRDLHDDAGRAFSAVTFPLLAAGSPPPPEPKRPSRKRRRS